MKGFTSFPEPVKEDKVRASRRSSRITIRRRPCSGTARRGGKGAHRPRFPLRADQGAGARGARARRGYVANVAGELAEAVAAGLGMEKVPPPLPLALDELPQPEVKVSPALSLFARPGDGSIRTRHVAILVAQGVDSADAKAIHAGLKEPALSRATSARGLAASRAKTATR